jgi:ABC-type nitrate/sulfonate/bicarbonate transport system substrate-binding protein
LAGRYDGGQRVRDADALRKENLMLAFVRRVAALLGVAAIAATAAPSSAAPELIPVRFSINPHFITYTALFDAIDKGYFRDAGLDLQLIPYKTSASAQLPKLARGDLDISVVVPGPGLFNAYAEGFNVKIIGSTGEAHKGYLDGSVLMVRKDLWDKGTIRKPSDLKGKNVDGAFQGSPIALLTLETITGAGLSTSDVQFTTKESTVADQFAALTNKAVDVQGTTEPTATAMVQKGVAVKWLSYRDVIPWYQDSYWAESNAFAKAHPDAAVKFLTAYLRGEADIAKTNGKLTPELVTMIAKWTQIPAETIRALGVTSYYGNFASINTESLERVQKFWQGLGLVKKPVAISQIVDPAPLAAARKTAQK